MQRLRVIEGEGQAALSCTCGKFETKPLRLDMMEALYDLAEPHVRRHLGQKLCPNCKVYPRFRGGSCINCRSVDNELRMDERFLTLN